MAAFFQPVDTGYTGKYLSAARDADARKYAAMSNRGQIMSNMVSGPGALFAKYTEDNAAAKTKADQLLTENARAEELLSYKRTAEKERLASIKERELLAKTVREVKGSKITTNNQVGINKAINQQEAQDNALFNALDAQDKAIYDRSESLLGYEKNKQAFVTNSKKYGKDVATYVAAKQDKDEAQAALKGVKFSPQSGVFADSWLGRFATTLGGGTDANKKLLERADADIGERPMNAPSVPIKPSGEIVPTTSALVNKLMDVPEVEIPKLLTSTKYTDATPQQKIDAINLLPDDKVSASIKLLTVNAIKKAEETTLDERKLAERIRHNKVMESKKKGAPGVKGFSFGKELYAAVGKTGGTGDVKAVTDYLNNNRVKITAMPKPDQQELLEYLKLQYGKEDEWLTWSGWDDIK